jgi:hypothetical protein
MSDDCRRQVEVSNVQFTCEQAREFDVTFWIQTGTEHILELADVLQNFKNISITTTMCEQKYN